MNKEQVTVWLKQGEGKDEIYMSVTMPKEVADMMGEIRGENSEKWENNDFDLHSEAIRRVKEKTTK